MKSWSFADALLFQCVKDPLRVLCAREIQKSIRDSVHKLLVDRIKAHNLGFYFTVLNTEIRGLNGSEIFYAGLWQNIDSIKSIESVDRVWVEESNKVSRNSWDTLIPSIRKPGSEIWQSFNPELKTDPAYQMAMNPPPNSLVRKVSYRDNPYISDEFIQEMEHLKATDYEKYLHVYEGELLQFADGAIYGQQIKQAQAEGRITKVPVESLEVNTFWDLGRNDTTAIWFHQRAGLQDRFIDYYECRLVDLDHYAKVLKEKGYTYGQHYLPHDVEVVVLGSGNRSRRDILEGLGVRPVTVVPRIDNINNGIEQTRKAFKTCWFDEDRCEDGLSALSNYQYQYDEKYETHRPHPLHNWASNGADAFRQFAQGYKPVVAGKSLQFKSEW